MTRFNQKTVFTILTNVAIASLWAGPLGLSPLTGESKPGACTGGSAIQSILYTF